MSSRPLQPTATPGIYRRGGRYVVVLRDRSGRQFKRSARTLAPFATAIEDGLIRHNPAAGVRNVYGGRRTPSTRRR
jgi:hypothetical protein